MSEFLPGMRIIKSVVSVLITLLLAYGIHYPTPFYACIACVIVMKSNPDESLVFGKGRMIGTLLGGAMGGLFIIVTGLLKVEPHSMVYALLVAFALFCDFMVAKIFRIGEYATSMSAILVLSVLITHNDTISEMLKYMTNRTLETLAGIFIAVVVNRYLSLHWLSKARKSQ